MAVNGKGGGPKRDFTNMYEIRLYCECDGKPQYEIDYKDKTLSCIKCGKLISHDKIRALLAQ